MIQVATIFFAKLTSKFHNLNQHPHFTPLIPEGLTSSQRFLCTRRTPVRTVFFCSRSASKKNVHCALCIISTTIMTEEEIPTEEEEEQAISTAPRAGYVSQEVYVNSGNNKKVVFIALALYWTAY